MQQLSFEINGVTTPMDVLLTLIAKHKLNIYDIAISQLLEQYLNYLADCQEQDLELAGAFLEMAARLIYLKTAALLPKPQEAQADKEDLQESLLLYARCKQAAAILAGRYKEQQPFCRHMPLPNRKTYLRTYPAEVLRSSFLSIGKKQLPPSKAAMQEKLQRVVSPKTVSVFSKIVWLMRKVSHAETVSLVTLYDDISDRSARVAVFLAVLELTKHGRIGISTDGTSLYRISRKAAAADTAPQEILV
ncbi:MAG: segregation and condensation protein A [Ruminococcus sp.]